MTFAGELVTEELEYDGGRQVTACLPPDSPEAVVFANGRRSSSQASTVAALSRLADPHLVDHGGVSRRRRGLIVADSF
jgi:hypothetical protein